jgi:hypothetical protein
MRGRVQVSIFLIACLIAVSRAAAFGPDGHRLAGDVATHYLCDEARSEVGEILDGQSLARAGQWPDWIRSESEWRHTRPWHYINVGDREPIESVNGSDQNVLWAIDRFERELADTSLSHQRRGEALRFFTHFVVDVHQPLHVGRAADRGGNTIDVRVAGRKTNLHRVWDAQALLRGARSGDKGYDRQLRGLIELTAARVRVLQSAGALEWARESQALRPRVYATGSPPGSLMSGAVIELDDSYLARALETDRLRLSEAGVRLAGRINGIFCPPPELAQIGVSD